MEKGKEFVNESGQSRVRTTMERRGFLSVLAAATAGLGVVACTPSEQTTKEEPAIKGDVYDPAVTPEEGEWITVPCWHNCGGSCVNKCLVKDGVIVRQKTDDTHEDTFETPQQRGCVRGRSTRHMIYGADRLKYPMKRKGWSPEHPNGEMRGRDEWERITWDEAFHYIGDMINKVVSEVGAAGILCPGNCNYGAGSNWKTILGTTGHMPSIDLMVGSPGTWNMNAPKYGLPPFDMGPYMMSVLSGNDRFDMMNAETIIINGGNPAWASGGNRMRNLMAPKENGTEFIYVGPSYNITAAALDAKWIRVLPGCDIPLLLAVAYEMIRLDREGEDLIDWDFLAKYTIGFTMDTVPENGPVQECFMDYVLGEYDGIPKTPAWATEYCGTPEEDITYYARALTKQKKVMLLHSYPAGRCNGAEDLPQLLLTCGLMGGHVGKSGHATGAVYHAYAGDCGPFASQINYAGFGTAGSIPYDGEMIMSSNMWDAILDGKYWYFGNGIPNNLWEDPVERECDIRMLWHEGNQGLQTVRNINRGIEAYRKLDFIVEQNLFMTTDAKYADIVLPVTTPWEMWYPSFTASRQASIVPRKAIEPIYDTKTDAQIAEGVMQAMGFDSSTMFPPSTEEISWIATLSMVETVLPDGTTSPLVSIPSEKFAEFGYPGMADLPGYLDWDEAMETGVYVAEPTEKNYRYIAYEGFISDPDANPLPSESGKFEIYCQWKSNYLNKSPYLHGVEFKPYPTFTSEPFGYKETFSDWENKVKGEYPFLMFQPHYLRRSHTVFDNIPWLRGTWENPVFLNATDAREKGIGDGDTVLIYNQHGKVLRRASLLESIMPGCIALPHGAWVDIDEKTGIDRAGADNVLIGSDATASNSDGYNNIPVNYEKYTGDALEPDVEWPQRIIDLD